MRYIARSFSTVHHVTAIVYTVFVLLISLLSLFPPSSAFAANEQRLTTHVLDLHYAASAFTDVESREQTSRQATLAPERGTFQTADGSIITWTADGDICTVTGFVSLTPTLTLPS